MIAPDGLVSPADDEVDASCLINGVAGSATATGLFASGCVTAGGATVADAGWIVAEGLADFCMSA